MDNFDTHYLAESITNHWRSVPCTLTIQPKDRERKNIMKIERPTYVKGSGELPVAFWEKKAKNLVYWVDQYRMEIVGCKSLRQAKAFLSMHQIRQRLEVKN